MTKTFSSLTKWLKRKDEVTATTRGEYANLLGRLVTRDDLKLPEMDRLHALHSEFGTGTLEATAATLAEVHKLREDEKELATARRDAVDALKASEAHDRTTLELAQKQDRELAEREEASDVLFNREQSVNATISELESRSARLRSLESQHWAAIGMDAAPVPVVAPPTPMAQLEREYQSLIDELGEFTKESALHERSEKQRLAGETGDLTRAGILVERLRQRQIEHLRKRKTVAALAMNVAREAAAIKPAAIREAGGSIPDPLSSLRPDNYAVEYRETHPRLPDPIVTEGPNLSTNQNAYIQ